jgi:acyl-CoA reductase-like NAD-dependent aldehyde dehydrogenase
MELTKEKAQRIASRPALPTKAFIDGHFCHTSDGATFETINATNAQVIANGAHCTGTDVDKAVTAARRSFNDGRRSRAGPEYRKKILLRSAALIRENTAELAVLESHHSGKTITDCLHEIGNEVADHFQWYAERADKTFGKVTPSDEEAMALIIKEPSGVVGVILLRNFPLLMAAWKLAPALAAGCSSIVKTAEQTPLSALGLAQLAQESGGPDSVLSVLPRMRETTGPAIGRHNDIDIFCFTGSTKLGGYFLRYAGESHPESVVLEMDGKSPFIILDDADLTDDLIEHAATAAFWTGGQNCSANMHRIVDAKIADSFLEKVIVRAKASRVGDPLDPSCDIGAMITQEHMAA